MGKRSKRPFGDKPDPAVAERFVYFVYLPTHGISYWSEVCKAVDRRFGKKNTAREDDDAGRRADGSHEADGQMVLF